MSKLLTAFALLLLVSALAVMVVPFYLPPAATRSVATESISRMSDLQATLLQVRQFAEQINAPLSVIVALLSLYYSRKGYLEGRTTRDR